LISFLNECLQEQVVLLNTSGAAEGLPVIKSQALFGKIGAKTGFQLAE